jgi:hypothetical protein
MNNTTILQRCVDELKKETPNLSYVQGMLETVIEMSAMQTPVYPPVQVPYAYPLPSNIGSAYNGSTEMGTGIGGLTPEEIYLQQYESGPIGNLSQ